MPHSPAFPPQTMASPPQFPLLDPLPPNRDVSESQRSFPSLVLPWVPSDLVTLSTTYALTIPECPSTSSRDFPPKLYFVLAAAPRHVCLAANKHPKLPYYLPIDFPLPQICSHLQHQTIPPLVDGKIQLLKWKTPKLSFLLPQSNNKSRIKSTICCFSLPLLLLFSSWLWTLFPDYACMQLSI